MHRQTINKGRTAYQPNSLNKDYPREVPVEKGGFSSYTERVDGHKIRNRSESFADHFSQAALFWNSQSDVEKEHIVSAFQFELSKVETPIIRERIVGLLARVNTDLATKVAGELGLTIPAFILPDINLDIEESKALSIIRSQKKIIRGWSIAILIEDGASYTDIAAIKGALTAQGADVKLIGAKLGSVASLEESSIQVDHAINTMPSVMFDAVFIPDGELAVKIKENGEFIHFIYEAYKHYKVIAFSGKSKVLMPEFMIDEPGILYGNDSTELIEGFINAVSEHRHWGRKNAAMVPA